MSPPHIFMSRTHFCLYDSIITTSFFRLGLGSCCRVVEERTAGCLVSGCGGVALGKCVKIAENVVQEGGEICNSATASFIGEVSRWVGVLLTALCPPLIWAFFCDIGGGMTLATSERP